MKNKILNIFFILCLLSLSFTSCHFISSFSEESVIELSFDKNSLKLCIGEMDIINLTTSGNQNKASISWEYDNSIISAKTDNYSAVITALKPGETTLKAICGSNSVSCLIKITDESYIVNISNPYVYTNTDYVELKPNQTQKVCASLFGGTPADLNGYTWSIDKPSVASLSTEGNYCWITGVNDGVAKLTVKHNKAAYGYSVLINCSSDGSTLTYITTDENIITINKSENDTAEFSVDLVNPLVSDYASGFFYTVINEEGNEVKGSLVVSSAEGLFVSLRAYETGNYYVRCSHPSAIYSLDVLVRVIENAEIAYIEPSSTQVTISGNQSQNISLSLVNYTGDVQSDLFSWSFSKNAEKYISYEIFNGLSETTGDNILIKGIKTGTVKITVSYPGMTDRSIIVLVRDIESEAASANTYITTSQNYIKLGLSDEASNISITLTESKNCDINELQWSIINYASDGSANDVIEWVVGTGNYTSNSAYSKSRAVTLTENTMAYATIKPVNPGTAHIDISHPKALYKTRITVSVTNDSEQKPLSSNLSLNGSPVVNILNGESKTVSIAFAGDGNETEIEWTTTNDKITLFPNGSECVINSPISGSGVIKATVSAKHKNSTYPVNFSVLCYDTEEELENNKIKAMYSLTTRSDAYVNNEIRFYLYTEGFSESDLISWEVVQGKDLVSFETYENNTSILVTAKATGKAVIKASCTDLDDVFFTINIKNIDIIDEEKTCYLSTSKNVLYFEDKGVSHDIEISAYNINQSSYSEIVFTCDSPDFEIANNGNKATITSLEKNVKATLKVSHSLSENTLEINLHCGKQYEFINEDSCYITTDKDTLELYAGQDEIQLTATLNHTETSENNGIVKGFTFVSDNPEIVSVSYVTYSNFCFVKPVKNGTAKITITHPDSDFEKEVIVVVNNAPDITTIPYITTQTNVITIIEGEYASATVELVNSTSIDSSLWTWKSSDSRICDVIANNGTTSMISANKPGTTEITVKHEECIYSLKLIIVVLDSSVITSRPYIQSSDSIITIKKGTSTTITAEMIGGTSSSDINYFRFNGSNSSVILVNGVSNSAYIKGVNTGMAYITISNTRYSSSYSKTVLVIVEDTQEEGIYIEPSTNIIKIKPDNSDLIKVSAELIGGDVTDGERFVWWVDDPNLIGITSIASECSIIPTGKSGATKIHIKHEKALKACDILVLISDYDTFAFGQTSLSVNSEKLYFVPLQVPAIEDEYTIEYTSSNEDICIIQGSNAVAWICGRNYGTASLTAKMKSKDGVELASSEMLVNVSVPDVRLPTISLGNTIMTVEAGTSKTFSAIINGENIDETEKYNLKWSWKCAKGNSVDGISILGEENNIAYGADTFITFNDGGEYVLYVEHEATGAISSMYIVVEEKGVITIELNSYLETMYKDDGSISISATLNNATENDYKNIEWSALKVGGQSIVSVSKAKGKTCTIVPRNIGQTSVVAKLPTGQTAKCIVIVKASTELVLDLGSIHVIPGYTEVINYKTTPENATINWISQMTNNTSLTDFVNYYSFEDDTAKKQLRITGLKDYPGGVAGTISGYIMGASNGNMETVKVYVEYDIQLELLDKNNNLLTAINNEYPDTSLPETFKIKYYPIDLDIDILAENSVLVCIPHGSNTALHSEDVTKYLVSGAKGERELFSIDMKKEYITEQGLEKCLMTVSLIPHYEGKCQVSVRASLPNAKASQTTTYSETKSFYYSAYYPEYKVEIDWEKYTPVGAFTRYKNGKLFIGDGEEAVFNVNIENENAAGSINLGNVTWDINSSNLKNTPNAITELAKTNTPEIYNKDSSRLDKAKKVFGKSIENIEDLPKNVSKNVKPETGVVYYTTDSATNTVRLSHNWDYYKDLPYEILSAEGWETYKNNHIYADKFLENLKTKGVDYWLISKEAYFLYNNKAVHFVKHPEQFGTENGISISNSWNITTSFSSEKEYDDLGITWYWKCYNTQTLKQELTFNNSENLNFSVCNCVASSNSSNLNFTYENKIEKENEVCEFFLKDCNPYVITTKELTNNQLLTIPDDKNEIYKKYWPSSNEDGNGSYDQNEWKRTSYISKLLHDGITPTVKKMSSNEDPDEEIGRGILSIPYTNPRGERGFINVNVVFEKRLCEAYTNNWMKYSSSSSGYTHWYSNGGKLLKD